MTSCVEKKDVPAPYLTCSRSALKSAMENVAGDSDCASRSRMTGVCPFAVINAKQKYDAFLTTPRQVVHQALLRCGYLEELP